MAKISIIFTRLLYISLIAALLSMFFANSSNAEDGKTTLDRINHQMNIYPQEKLHMVTDREIYYGGDTVWCRIFVVDAASHQHTSISKYVYVELLNPFGKVQNRVKIIERDGVYAGYFPIDEDIYEGNYTLAAYTMYSENQGKDFFFRKPLRILDQHSSKYIIDSEFKPVGPGEVKGTFKVRSANGEKMNYNKMSWTMPDGKFLDMPDSKNGFSKKFSRDKGEDVVLVKFGDYGKYVNVEYPIEKTEIIFYPEGGWLIADEPCTVAFKATDENGKGVSASGVIRVDTGEEIATFSTIHKGMGSVTFVPEAGRTYTAEYTGPEAELRTAEIGSPKPGAACLRYRATKSKGTFSVGGGENNDLELVIALRGAGIIATPISSTNPLSFDKKDMPVGLYQAMLVSKTDSAVISERLFFIGADRINPNSTDLSNDSTSIKFKTQNGIGGDCSVRVINTDILSEKTDGDIRTQLLLQSELRGRIENPSEYFASADRETERNLDLLMMVNGWSRYNLPEAILEKYSEPKIPVEIGQEISGQVRSRWKGNPMEGIRIYAIAPKYDFGTFADTDKNGNFYINGFDFPEGTTFIFRAMNEKGGNESNYEIFNDNFPNVDLIHDVPYNTSSINAVDFFNGMRWTMLEEIKVQAFKEEDIDIFQSLATYSKSAEEMDKRGVTSLEEALRLIPGLSKNQNRFLWRSKYIAYYIDGTIYESAGGKISTPVASPPGSLPGTYHTSRFASLQSERTGRQHQMKVQNLQKAMERTSSSQTSAPTISDIENVIPFHDIDRIDFIRPELFVMGSQYGGGVIMITSKSGRDMHWSKQFELKDHLPLGYQQYKEYASPLLSVDVDEYDLQTHPTLLWLPSVKFDDSGKTIDLKLPLKSQYRVIIEGLTDNGEIISETL